ncbi:MAG TPA: autotransporter-associated beta strand repeat-containing protein, partial [Chthoniobacteraceae bacterium]|nr:autotransporter-associated beta strand repeat-containing protein [Chthoniobacteraceae bacterium]
RVMPGATLTLNRSDAALVMNNSIVVDGVVSKTGPGTVTLAGNISGNGAPSISTGTLILSGTNTYGAVTNIGAAGILAVGSDSALGTNNVRLNTAGATLTAAGSATRTISNLIDVAVSPTNFGVPGSGDLIFSGTFATGNGAKVMNINNTTTTVTGIVTGGPSANLVTKAGTGTLVLANPGNTFVRPITINAGTLQIASEGNLGVAPAAATANHLAFTGGTLRTTSNMSIDDATRGITLGTGGGTFEVDASTTLSVVNKITGAAGDLRKTGAGILSLEGANDYTGTTTVSAGTLLVQGSLSGSNVAVNGGTLGGAGSITTGATGLTLNAGARLTPGAPATAGILAVNAGGSILDLTAAVTPTASGALLFDLDTPALSDKVLLSSGSLTIGTGVLGFDDFAFNTFAGIAQNNVYVLFDGVAPINGQLASNVTGSIGAFTGQLQLADGGNDLVLVVVPEPSAAALLMIGTVGFFGKRRRQPRLAV